MGFGGTPNLACSELDVPLICPQRALVVQWIERQTSNLNVGGSSPSGRTTSITSSKMIPGFEIAARAYSARGYDACA